MVVVVATAAVEFVEVASTKNSWNSTIASSSTDTTIEADGASTW